MPLLTRRTRLVAFPHVSNVLGGIVDVAAVTRLVHDHGAQVCVDGVAYAPHRAIDVRGWDVDYYVFSFYKVYGPHLAVLYGKRERLAALAAANQALLGDQQSYKLQTDNANYELTYSLTGIYEYIESLGGKAHAFAAIAAHEERLADQLLGFLRARRGVRIHGEPSADRSRRVPTISFTVKGGVPEAIVRSIDDHGIGIRHGNFSKATVRALGLDSHGVIRVSMVHYNTPAEITRLVTALDAAIAAVEYGQPIMSLGKMDRS